MKNVLLLLIIFLITGAWASRPKIVTIDSRPQFERGTAKNISISDKGILSRSPELSELFHTATPLILAMATDSKGNIYVGTGNAGHIYRTNAKKDSTLFFTTDELVVSTLAMDSNDNLYAGTFPDGKIYKINQQGESHILFDPEAQYIWDIKLDQQGTLYIATGQPAQLIQISANGKKKVLLEPETEHVRSLAILGETIYAGTSGKAYIFQIEKDKKPTILYDPQTEEVTSLFVADARTLYAATLGEAVTPTAGMIQRQQQNTNEQENNNGNANSNSAESNNNTQAIMQAMLYSLKIPTSLFQINLNGLVQDFWTGKPETIQGIFPAADGGILVGTGKNGKIYKVSETGIISLLYELPEQHISSFSAFNDKILLATSNPGSIYQLGPQAADTCQYISEVTDAGMKANWGTFSYTLLNDSKKVKFYTRAGNTEKPNNYWYPWKEVNLKSKKIDSPSARFFQWRCDFIQDAELSKVSFSYQQINFPPKITAIIVHRSGDYYSTEKSDNADKGIIYPAMLPSKSEKKGFRTVDWLFQDPNYDRLKFDISYRQVGSDLWFSMQKDWPLNYYSWDTAQMADGEYEIKVQAKDAEDDKHDHIIRSFEISDPFTVDNSGPNIRAKQAKNDKGEPVLKINVTDELSLLSMAEYSIDTSDWQKIQPLDKILDDKQETFIIPLPNAKPHHIAVKVKDIADNYSIIHINTDRL